MSRSIKILGIVLALSATIMIAGVHQIGLFPSVLVFSFVSVSAIVFASYAYDLPHAATLIGIVGVAIATRVVIFVYPASLIGNDTDKKAFWASEVIRLGSTDGIYSEFYQSAPLMYLHSAGISEISGISTAESFLVYPIIMGVILPVTAVLLTRSLLSHDYWFPSIAAGGIAAVATAGMQHSYWPIAQTYAVAIWCLLLISLIAYIRHGSWSYLVLLLLFITGLTFAHKLPVIVVLGLLTTVIVHNYAHDFIRRREPFERFTDVSIRPEQSLFLISGLILYLHWGYVSHYVDDVIRRVGTLLAQHSVSPPSAPTKPTAVEPVNPGLIGDLVAYPSAYSFFFERSHAVVLLLTAGVCWVYVLFVTYRHDRFERTTAGVLLGGSAFGVILTFFGVLSIGAINPNRPLMMIEPILAVLIGVTVFDIAGSFGSLSDHAAVIGIGLLLFSQVFAAPAIPDYPNTPRYYLSDTETAGRSFGCEYADGIIHTDSYVTQEQYIDGEYCARYSSLDRHHPDSPLFNAGLPHSDIETVAYRSSVDVYLGTYSRWRLTWDPKSALESEYNNVYNNGDVSIYLNRSTTQNEQY